MEIDFLSAFHGCGLFQPQTEILVIRRATEDDPELYLDELQAWLEYQTGEVFVRQMGLTVKVLKARDQQSNVRSSLRNERKRAEFRRFTAHAVST